MARARFRADVLRNELACRGLTGEDFADLAKIAPETLSRVLGGRPANARTTRAIINTLARVPQLTGASALIEAGR
jgi:predicted transcriptional regulator